MVVWLTGLSGAGKTTICRALFERAKERIPELVLLDGDALRDTISSDLGFSEADRAIQIGRVQRLASMLSSQDLVVLVAVVYAHPELLAWNRANIPEYFEVLVDTSLDEVQRRDAKGLYRRARARLVSNVVGVDIPWHRPENADLVITPVTHPSVDAAVSAIEQLVPRFAIAKSTP